MALSPLLDFGGIKVVLGLNYSKMTALRKVLTTNYAIAAGNEITFDIPNTFNLKNFTIEAELNAFAYPAGENDAVIALQDSESGSDYEDVDGGIAYILDAATSAKLRVVDLSTQNIRVRFNTGSANAGTLTKLSITFTT